MVYILMILKLSAYNITQSVTLKVQLSNLVLV